LRYWSNDQTLFPKYAQPGNILWIIGTYGDQPPSLEARIHITDVTKHASGKPYRTLVEGPGNGSCFFGRNDASDALMDLVFKSERGLWSLSQHGDSWRSGFGRRFRAPRRLAGENEERKGLVSPGAGPLKDLSANALKRSIFISWKHSDNEEERRQDFIENLTYYLSKLKFAIWWDRLALPGPGKLDEGQDENEIMNDLLKQGLRQARVILSLWTCHYGEQSKCSERNWTRNEWQETGFRKRRLRIALSPKGKASRKDGLENPDVTFSLTDAPEVLAQKLNAWLSQKL